MGYELGWSGDQNLIFTFENDILFKSDKTTDILCLQLDKQQAISTCFDHYDVIKNSYRFERFHFFFRCIYKNTFANIIIWYYYDAQFKPYSRGLNHAHLKGGETLRYIDGFDYNNKVNIFIFSTINVHFKYGFCREFE